MTGPTPQSDSTGSLRRKASTRDERSRSAIGFSAGGDLREKLLAPRRRTPSDPSSRGFPFQPPRHLDAEGNFQRFPSRRGSPVESGSTSGVADRKIAKTCRDTSRYRANRAGLRPGPDTTEQRETWHAENPESPGFVARGGDDALALRPSPTAIGLASAGRPLLDRGRRRPCHVKDLPDEGTGGHGLRSYQTRGPVVVYPSVRFQKETPGRRFPPDPFGCAMSYAGAARSKRRPTRRPPTRARNA